MARSPERRQPPHSSEAGTNAEPVSRSNPKSAQPASPARSDKSSDSEGREVRQNLKETNLNAPPSADTVLKSDIPMADTNGTDAIADPSTSGSESGRGRLRRKRSREDFEDEAEKPQEKKFLERHVRKKSRDVTSPIGSDVEVQVAKPNNSVSRIDEQEGEGSMLSADDSEKPQRPSSDRPSTPETGAPTEDASAIVSPKNKRTLSEAQSGDSASVDGATKESKDNTQASKERDAKRPRDTDGAVQSEQGKSKIPPGSGFANTSAASPFSSLSSTQPKTSASTSGTVPKDATNLPQTSDDKFKASGFGSFASSSASPFGGISKPSSSSPFGAAADSKKVTSFASSTNTSSSLGSGFGALGANSNKSAFSPAPAAASGSSVFGGALSASSFGNFGGSKTGFQSFATPGAQTITGLKQKGPRPFGAAHAEDLSEDEDEDGNGDDEDPTAEDDPDKIKNNLDHEKRPTFQPTEVETGEEGEEARWVGRAKLYTMDGEGNNRGWHERGVGPFKLNITKEPPTRARFVLRADGTHRLLLNAAVTRNLTFGDADGKKPLEGRLLFNTPTPDGKLEMHLLRMKADKAAELWEKVERVKNLLL